MIIWMWGGGGSQGGQGHRYLSPQVLPCYMKYVPQVRLCHGEPAVQAVRHSAEQLQRRHQQHVQVGGGVIGQGLPQQGQVGGQAVGDVEEPHGQEAACLTRVVHRVLQEL